MTADNGPENKTPGNAGKENRPYATLDLTAEDISSDEEPSKTSADSSGAAEKKSSGAAAGDGGEQGTRPRGEAYKALSPPRPLPESVFRGVATQLAAGVAGGVIAVLLSYAIYGGQKAPDDVAPQTQALQDAIENTRIRIASVESGLKETLSQTAQAEAATAEIGVLKQDIASLSVRLQALEARPPASAASEQVVQQSLDPLTSRLSVLEERLGRVAQAQSEMQSDSKAAALALALYNLRRATHEGKPFASELKSVAEMSPVPLDLSALELLRDQGVKSLDQLITGFSSAANAALESENQPADDSFASGLWAKVKSFVRVRRKGDVPGDTTRAILARTEHRLEAADLNAALAETKQLQGAAAKAMEPWQSELKARIAADDALAQVEARLLTALGGEAADKRGG